MEFPKRVKKTWGKEIWFANDEQANYCGKELRFKPEFQTSIHRHLVKDEVFYVVAGLFCVQYGPDANNLQSVRLCPGDRLHVPSGVWHRIQALETGEHRLIEVSTFHSDEDVERCAPSGSINLEVSAVPRR